MAYETDLRETPIPEEVTSTINFTVEDEDGTGLAQADLDTLTVTLYNDRDDSIINSQDGTNIKGVNGGAVGAGGAGTWDMDELDNPIVDSGLSQEDHTAEFTWTYDGATKTGRHRVRLRVANFVKVT